MIEYSEYWEIEYSALRPSSSNVWPTSYKFIGVEILFNTDKKTVSRETYHLFQLFGDIGGLDAALVVMGSLLMSSYAQFNAYSFLIR